MHKISLILSYTCGYNTQMYLVIIQLNLMLIDSLSIFFLVNFFRIKKFSQNVGCCQRIKNKKWQFDGGYYFELFNGVVYNTEKRFPYQI